MKKKILVTGGAGYIGSHTVRALLEEGWEVVVVDSLVQGRREFVPSHVKLYITDVKNTPQLVKILQEEKPSAVIHFASFIQAEESVKKPLKYYENNVAGSISLFSAMISAGVKCLVFSSSAAVYGKTERIPIPEDTPPNPLNPYGKTKHMVEEILKDLDSSGELVHVSLRYFNAAGAHPSAEIGEAHDPETHLIPLLLQTAAGKRNKFTLHLATEKTPDGTSIRDFIHVVDLARAHVLALEYLLQGGKSEVFNCGYGRGYSVREIVEVAKKVSQRDFPVEEAPPRPGDPPVLVADPSRIKNVLNWKPLYDDIEFIVKTAWEWEKKRK